jgi:hypothetical protein
VLTLPSWYGFHPNFEAVCTITLLSKCLVIKKHPGDNFWDKVEAKLDNICKKADNNKDKIKR